MKTLLGGVFVLGALACLFFAYVNGGPAWGQSFDVRYMIRQGGHLPALGAVACMMLAVPLLRAKRSAARSEESPRQN